MMTAKIAVCIVAGLLMFGAGLVTGMRWRLPAQKEAYAPQQRQRDGSLILERNPEGKVDVPQIPKGATLERAVSVVVSPRGASDVVTPLTPGEPPQDVGSPQRGIARRGKINLAIVRLSDGTRRVIASSPDFDIEGGIDVPVESRPAEAGAWGVGPVYSGGHWGGQVMRSFGRVSVNGGAVAGTYWIGAAVRF